MSIKLITADLHLTDNPLDYYKWEFFNWLTQQIEERKVAFLYILGDITEKKNGHNATLVNKIVKVFRNIPKTCDIKILSGNHDYSEKTEPYFEFLSEFENIKFINTITHYPKLKQLFIPHTFNPSEDWKDLDKYKDIPLDYIFLHQAIKNSKSSSGYELQSGISADYFKDFNVKRIIAGDIHVPQDIGNVTYVGSPYPVYFGDNFTPRVFLDTDGVLTDLHYPCIKRAHIQINHPEELLNQGLSAKDQLKVTLHLHPSEIHKWHEYKKDIKKICLEKEFILCGSEMKVERSIDKELGIKTTDTKIIETKEEVLSRFITKEKLDVRYLSVAKEFMG